MPFLCRSCGAGYFSDTLMRRRFKSVILRCMGLLLVAVAWFTLSVPSLDGDNDSGGGGGGGGWASYGSFRPTTFAPAGGGSSAVLPGGAAALGVALTLAGLAQSATTPLLYELCAELTYPGRWIRIQRAGRVRGGCRPSFMGKS